MKTKNLTELNFSNKDFFQMQNLEKLRQTEVEFVEEIKKNNPQFVQDSRIEYLQSEISRLDVSISWACDSINALDESSKWFAEILKSDIAKWHAEKEKFQSEIFFLQNPREANQGYTKIKIQRAKNQDVGKYLTIKKREGKIIWCKCPFHADNRPSLAYYKNQKKFYCFQCNFSDDLIGLIMKTKKLNFQQAVNYLLT